MAQALDINRDVLKQHRDLMRQLDKDVQKTTRAAIKGEVSGVAQSMQSWIASADPLPPLSGMGDPGRLQWSNPNVKASVRLSAGPGKELASIYATGRARRRAMFAIVERAGSKSDGFSPQGERMIRVLDDRFPKVGQQGRMFFPAFLKYRPDIQRSVVRGLNILARVVNAKARF